MRFLLTTKQDMQYQMRYGFYFIYGILTLFYVLILSQINDPVLRSLTGSLIILSDPAVLGYFFIGGIWLLEQEEDLHSYMAISPLKGYEYVLGKMLSLGLVSTCSATIIAAITMSWINPFALAGIVFISSCFFTLVGLLLATFAKTVNSYLMLSVPPALLLLTPGIASLFGIALPFAEFLPGTMVLKLIQYLFGKLHEPFLFKIFGLSIWTGVLFVLVVHRVTSKINPSRRNSYARHS